MESALPLFVAGPVFAVILLLGTLKQNPANLSEAFQSEQSVWVDPEELQFLLIHGMQFVISGPPLSKQQLTAKTGIKPAATNTTINQL